MDFTRESNYDLSEFPQVMPVTPTIDAYRMAGVPVHEANRKKLTIVGSSAGSASKPKATLRPSYEQLFVELTSAWKRETAHVSNPAAIAMHPAYQRIIGMGPKVLPLIIDDLKSEPDWWFWALRAIAGVDPVREEQRGKLRVMADAWLQWWEEDGSKQDAQEERCHYA